MRLMTCALGLIALPGLLVPAALAETPVVAATIKPVHSLAAALMEGVGEPVLLVGGASSPHGFSLKPSAARAVQDAGVILWVGPGLEAFLVRPLQTMAADARVVTLSAAPGVHLLANRNLTFHDHGGEEHGDVDEHDEHATVEDAADDDHEHGAHDLHIWLDPDNARAMAARIAAALAAEDPANAGRYEENLELLESRIDELDGRLATMLAPVQDRPFLVFHDAYQYFVEHYDLNEVAAIAIDPERPAGARWLRTVRARLDDLGPACLFTEPSFAPDLIDTVATGQTRTGTLDPIGAGLKPGPELYFELMEGLAGSLVECVEDLG